MPRRKPTYGSAEEEIDDPKTGLLDLIPFAARRGFCAGV